jgi:hypothetical protein
LFDGGYRKQNNTTHHSDGDLKNISMTWSAIADVVSPPPTHTMLFEVMRER